MLNVENTRSVKTLNFEIPEKHAGFFENLQNLGEILNFFIFFEINFCQNQPL